MEPVARVTVTVTFLRMDRPPPGPSPGLPTEYQVVHVRSPTVGFYRYLYNTVGADYVWWLRRTMPDHELASCCVIPPVSIHVLYSGGQPAGFFELDGRGWPDINLSYFGLMPHAIGAGVGYPFLRHAVDAAWRHGPRGMTVNTCTADHPRALPTYLRAGFRTLRRCGRCGTCHCVWACGFPIGCWRMVADGDLPEDRGSNRTQASHVAGQPAGGRARYPMLFSLTS